MRLTLRTSKKGFTLAEVILVIIIIGLISGIGAGVATGTLKSLQVKKAARDFLLAAKFARITAIEQQQYCTIELNRDENMFAVYLEIFNAQSGEVEKVPIRNQFFKPVKLPGQAAFEEVEVNNYGVPVIADESSSSVPILFYADGTAQAAIVQIGDGRDHYTISINPATGRAKLFTGTADNAEIGVVDLNLEQQ